MRQRLAELAGSDVSADSPIPQIGLSSGSNESCRANAAFSRVVAWVNVRDRSVNEVTSRLRKESFSSEEIEDAIRRACSCGILDDARFASSFVRGKARLGWGRRKIALALFEHGISLDSYPEVELEYLAPELQEGRAHEIASKRPLDGKNPVEKLARFLIGRGFDASLSYEVARSVVQGRLSNM